MTSNHQNNTSDPLNLALNRAYAILDGECRAAINAVGLELSVGFLHETSGYQTKQSLVCNLQEPFRWIADMAVMEAFESRVLDLPDFYFTGDDYRYRIEADEKRRFLDLLRGRFKLIVRYNSRTLRWDTIIEQKVVELGNYLIGRSTNPDFLEPAPMLTVAHDQELRMQILSLSQSDAKKLGIEKSTLHGLRSRAGNPRSLKIYAPVRKRLVWEGN